MNEAKKLSVEKRLDAIEARVEIISVGFNEILTNLAGIDNAEKEQRDAPSDPAKYNEIFWETATGSKGEYQKTSEKATQNHPIFQELMQRLKKNQGKARLGGYFYWIFDKDPSVVGRKKC